MTEEEIASAAISRLGGWIAHDGENHPAGVANKNVQVLLRNGITIFTDGRQGTWWYWRHDEDPTVNIVAYRIIN